MALVIYTAYIIGQNARPGDCCDLANGGHLWLLGFMSCVQTPISECQYEGVVVEWALLGTCACITLVFVIAQPVGHPPTPTPLSRTLPQIDGK